MSSLFDEDDAPASNNNQTQTAPTVVAQVDPSVLLDYSTFQSCLPEKMRKSINQELVDRVNATLSNPEEFEQYRNNLISYTSVMQDGKFKIEQYLDAVQYVSHKLRGATNIEAYMKTFPDKYKQFVLAGVAAKDIASYVTAYNKGKLVNLIMEQTLVPVHVLNMDMYQKALNAQFELGMSAQSEKVRSDALNSVLQQLRPPEVKKAELAITVKESDAIKSLKELTLGLAEQQRQAIASGLTTAKETAHQKLITESEEVQYIEVGK
ncbi:hypothetical protein [Chryseobacterium sp.]|uniref:hypothetical protein n=1 Tax=Chryseobacterium sp. TaxID=1871047 RepID=UPI00321B9300